MPIPTQQRAPSRRTDAGYAMAGLLVAIAIMGITMSMIMPTWRTWAKREKEAELIFRGEQYMRAIELYQRRFAGAYPTDVDALIDQRFLRKAFTDPITGDEFEILTQGSLTAEPIQAPPGAGSPGVPEPQQSGRITRAAQERSADASPTPFTEAARDINEGGGGIIGVVSSSTETSMALYNGRNRYDEWLFVYLPRAAQPGLSTGVPGDRGGVPGQGGPAQPGPGPAFGGFGQISGLPDDGARGRGGRGGQEPGLGGLPQGIGTPQGDRPGDAGVPLGTPPRR